MSGTGTKVRLDDLENLPPYVAIGSGADGIPAALPRVNYIHLDIADGSADTTYYVVSPASGNITSIMSVIDGAVSTADITLTARIGSTAITGGVVTIATSGSAAGDVDSATPTALNSITAGAALNLVVAGGGSGGSPRIHVVIGITRA